MRLARAVAHRMLHDLALGTFLEPSVPPRMAKPMRVCPGQTATTFSRRRIICPADMRERQPLCAKPGAARRLGHGPIFSRGSKVGRQ